MSALGFAELTNLTGGRFGIYDVPCPLCGPIYNPGKPVLRIWQDEPAFIRFHCCRCGAKGYGREDGATPIPMERIAQLRAQAAEREAIYSARQHHKAVSLWCVSDTVSG